MSANETFNLASLKMVHEELLATIEQAALRLEQFSTDRKNGELLQACIEGIKEIRGIINVIELKGIDLLADEILAHLCDIALGDDPKTDRQLELLTSAFFMMPRYLEFCLQTSRSMGLLLIPQVNELRQARRLPPLPESYYFACHLPANEMIEQTVLSVSNDSLLTLRRLRHMYQVGLLKVIQGSQVDASLGIMCRALSRLDALKLAPVFGDLWVLASTTLAAVGSQSLRITKSRKMLFSSLDREIKRLQLECGKTNINVPDSALIKELLYLLRLSGATTEPAQTLLEKFAVPTLGYSDAALAREIDFLHGPSMNTVNSMVAVLTDELHSTKSILERAMSSGAEILAETPELLDTLKKIADILSLVGLIAPSTSLKQEISKIQSWQASGAAVTGADLLGVADTLLYVESSISGLARSNLSDEALKQINTLSRDDVMANNQIAEAEKLVIHEIEAGLAMVKRALSAFAESNYDKAHIANIASVLDSVRGGMFVLGLPRVAKVLSSCIAFVNDELMGEDLHPAIQPIMETFADTIISLEYYVDNLKVDKKTDTDVLLIAEESLEALGFKV